MRALLAFVNILTDEAISTVSTIAPTGKPCFGRSAAGVLVASRFEAPGVIGPAISGEALTAIAPGPRHGSASSASAASIATDFLRAPRVPSVRVYLGLLLSASRGRVASYRTGIPPLRERATRGAHEYEGDMQPSTANPRTTTAQHGNLSYLISEGRVNRIAQCLTIPVI